MDDKKKYLKVLDELDPKILEIGESLKDDEIKQQLAGFALLVSTFTKAKREDQDLASLKEKVKDASAVYSEGIKVNRARIEYMKDLLVSRGKYEDTL